MSIQLLTLNTYAKVMTIPVDAVCKAYKVLFKAHSYPGTCITNDQAKILDTFFDDELNT